MRPKALTLWQPWASLVVLGAKQFETRSWATSYRGRLVIHAGRRWSRQQQCLCAEEPFRSALREGGLAQPEDLPLGLALGLVDLVEIFPVATVADHLNPWERAFGDYGEGRFAWQLANPRP